MEITKYPSGQISSRPRLGPQFSIAFWKGSNGTPFIFQKKHLKRLVKYIIPYTMWPYFHPTKKIHKGLVLFFVVFFQGARPRPNNRPIHRVELNSSKLNSEAPPKSWRRNAKAEGPFSARCEMPPDVVETWPRRTEGGDVLLLFVFVFFVGCG